MAKAVWSFNTTVRNPERIQNFLRALKELEGMVFDEEVQAKFFGLQIKKRLYKPSKKTLAKQELVNYVHNDAMDDIPDNIVEEILNLYQGKRVDASGRGRTSAGILNRFGLCVASKARGPVVITSLGKKWLANEIQDQELFFKFFLKWQYQNPIEDGYKEFSVKPFVGTIMLIKEVNQKWQDAGFKPVGLSKKEFTYYVTSLISYEQVALYANEIIKLRKHLKKLHGKERKDFEDIHFLNRLSEIFKDGGNKQKQRRDLKDYGDSAVRYFRMSDLIYKRGKGHYIDLSPDHKIEIDSLIGSQLKNLMQFGNFDEYLDYLIDTTKPKLPWEDDETQRSIKNNLIDNLNKYVKDVGKEKELRELLINNDILPIAEQISNLRAFKNGLQIEQLRQLRYDGEKLKDFIDGIKNTLSDRPATVTTRPSLDLEWFTSLSLMVLNDAEIIKPSYKLGDDGIPTGFMSNLPDIECFYETFGLVVEVTLLVGRDQWYAEGQPVMRHLRDFEERNQRYGVDIYGVFVAPHLHRDTLNTFWSAIRHDFEGKKMKIIPFTVDQYLKILKFVGEIIDKGYQPTHKEYLSLLNLLYNASSDKEYVNAWIADFDSLIQNWQANLLKKV